MSHEFETYFADFTEQTQRLLHEVYSSVIELLPHAAEKMSYGMPCFYQNQNVLYFAAFKNHIRFYPTAYGVKAFEHDLSAL
jgi:uncharacterized protein YdhG (YjbR/CyaY superfamily)